MSGSPALQLTTAARTTLDTRLLPGLGFHQQLLEGAHIMVTTLVQLDDSPVRVTIGTADYCDATDSGDRWQHYRYAVTITYRHRTMRTSYSQGMAYPVGQVDPADVLHSLTSDYESGRWDSFESWCDDYGYDSDSRRAERIYRALDDNRTRMDRVFGDSLDALLETYADR